MLKASTWDRLFTPYSKSRFPANIYFQQSASCVNKLRFHLIAHVAFLTPKSIIPLLHPSRLLFISSETQRNRLTFQTSFAVVGLKKCKDQHCTCGGFKELKTSIDTG